jgi:tetratricopeptide (TPR) repeat protein
MLSKPNTSQSRKKLIVYIILTVVTLAVFWQVHGFEFINFDDQAYITQNGHIQSGLTLNGIRWAFSTGYADLWNPLVWLSFMLDYQFYGLNAGGYHITNLILHILSSLLLFWLFCRMTGEIWPSAFVAAFFALHPLHVESVAWIAERKDVLSAFFWMLTLCLYVYYTEKPALKRYLLVVFAFVLALMSKPMVVTLPVVMILLDYWPLNRFESQKGKTNLMLWQLKEKIPFFVLSAVIVIFTFFNPHKPDTSLQAFPLSSRLANAPIAFVIYLEKTFWPHDLAAFYPFSNQIPAWQVIWASLTTFLITTAVILMAKRLPYLFMGWMWFAITIAPVIGIIQISLMTPYSMADRYHYLTSIGIAVMLAWGISTLFKAEELRKKILFPTAIAILVVLAILTWQQCGFWKNSIELWNHALKVTKNNFLAHSNYASALYEEGYIEEALNHYNKAINLKPDNEDGSIYNSRGAIYSLKNQYQLAMNDYNKAIDLNAACYGAYNNRGIVHVHLGQYKLAIDDFNKATYLKPDFAEPYSNRAFIYFKQGNKISCCSNAKKACELGNCKIWEAFTGEGFCR